MSDWDRVGALLDGVNAQTADPAMPPRVKSLASYAAQLSAEFKAAKSASKDLELPRLERATKTLWADVEAATGTGPKRHWKEWLGEQFTFGTVIGLFVLVVTFVGVAVMLAAIINSSPPGALQTIEGARPIITLAAIIATIAFGGGLVFASLFANDASFETRFRTSREIFLVFSGVFATVVGFHFGAGQTTSAPVTPTSISVSNIEEKDGKLRLTIAGGAPPFKVEADFGGGKKKTAEGESPITIDMADVDLTKPVPKLTFTVTDKSKGKQDLTIENVTKGFTWKPSTPPFGAPTQ